MMNQLERLIGTTDKTTIKKVVSMSIMFLLIIFTYSILRSSKDLLALYGSITRGSGAIPYLKSFVTLPLSVIVFILYSYVTPRVSAKTIFNATVLSFVIFYLAYGFYIGPNAAALSFSEAWLAPKLEFANKYGGPFADLMKNLFNVIAIWPVAIFYTMAELWGTAMISLLFWSFANQVTTTQEARVTYSVLALSSNVGTISAGIAGLVIFYINTSGILKSESAFDNYIKGITIMVALCGLGIVLAFNRATGALASDPKQAYLAERISVKQKKGMIESLKVVFRSSYLFFLVVMVIAYATGMSFVELIWKNETTAAFTRENFALFQNYLTILQGVVALIISLYFKNLINKFGWNLGAIITPIVLSVGGGIMFALCFAKIFLLPVVSTVTQAAITSAIVYLGAAQNIITKSCKYVFFDPTKELAYIPLDPQEKVYGKAAVDVVGGRLGKAAGNLMLSTLIFPIFAAGLNNYDKVYASALPIGILFAITCVAFFAAKEALGRKYVALLAAQEKTEEAHISVTPVVDSEVQENHSVDEASKL